MWLLDKNVPWPLIMSCEEVAERKCKRAGGGAVGFLALATTTELELMFVESEFENGPRKTQSSR